MRRTDIGALGSRVRTAKRSLAGGKAARAVNDTWADRRGIDSYRGTFDVIGNFPGYATNASLIVNATLVVTERFLLIDEWAPHGFALELDQIVDVSVDADPETFEDVLIRFRSDSGVLLFRLRVSRSRIPVRGKSKVIELTATLAAANVSIAEFARVVSDAYSASWESLERTDSDAVVWKGRLTAPLRPGRECAPTDVWVTPTALIWGSTRGRGINRIPLTAIERLGTVTLNDGPSSPAVYVKTSPIGDTGLDLPFIFIQSDTLTPLEARSGFLAIFRGDSVQEMAVINDCQPWSTLGELPETQEPEVIPPTEVDLVPESGGDLHTEEAGTDDVGEPDPVFETWADVRRPAVFPSGDTAEGGQVRRIDSPGYDDSSFVYDSTGTRLVDALISWPGGNQLYDVPPPEPEPISEPKELLTYLARARRTIDEVNQAVDRRVAGQAAPLLRAMPPSSEEQSRALAELIELAGTDYYSVEQTRTVKIQITRLGEAAIRLRSLLELCNAGHMTISEVALKRDIIMAGLPLDEGVE